MKDSLSGYLLATLRTHIGLSFDREALALFDQLPIKFGLTADVPKLRDCIFIPQDGASSAGKSEVKSIFGIEFDLPVPTKAPSGLWKPIELGGQVLWFENEAGVILPARNYYSPIVELLTFQSERRIDKRDKHDRFLPSFVSEEVGSSIVPYLNDFAFFLVGLGLHQAGFDAKKSLSLVKPPRVVLSHDCDCLTGNEFFTQLARLSRCITGPLRGNWYQLTNIWWSAYNSLRPKSFYYNNVLGMLDVESLFGYRSTLYILNGYRGRYGARHKDSINRELLKEVSDRAEIGIHYNYDTYKDLEALRNQLSDIQEHASTKVIAGRAHYLRFDPLETFSHLEQVGVRFDESVGSPEGNAVRTGIAGVFRSYSEETESVSSVWELGLQFWDSYLTDRDSIDQFQGYVKHLAGVGGIVSLLVHPGQFYNLESPNLTGKYLELLTLLADARAQSTLPSELVSLADCLWDESVLLYK